MKLIDENGKEFEILSEPNFVEGALVYGRGTKSIYRLSADQINHSAPSSFIYLKEVDYEFQAIVEEIKLCKSAYYILIYSLFVNQFPDGNKKDLLLNLIAVKQATF